MGSLLSHPKPVLPFSHLLSIPVGNREYDYIIIGSSPSGCVLAARLSEDEGVSVLLVEAGGSDEGVLYSRVPAGWTKCLMTDVDWAYHTIPQDNLAERELFWPRGKLLGGSSSINAMIYHHSSPIDYDVFADMLHAPEWGYAALAQYFKRAERHTPHHKHDDVDMTHRGLSGLWHTGYAHSTPMLQAWVAACQSLGIPYTADLNTPSGSLGTTTFSTFVDPSGARSSGSTAYLSPAVLARNNLTVCVRTRCTRVLFSKDGKQAIGVELVDESAGPEGARVEVKAKREVLLCAGAVGSAHLLLLSGLGPADELAKVGVECVTDLQNVGRNLQDHLTTPVLFRAKPQHSMDYLAQSASSGLLALARWALGFGGPMTSNGAEVGAFVRSDDPSLGLMVPEDGKGEEPVWKNEPDIELIAGPTTFYSHGRVVPPPGAAGMVIAALPIRPKSTGTITLRSSNPWDYPLIDPKYLSHPYDLPITKAGIRLSLRLARTSPLSSYLAPLPLDRGSMNPDDIATDVYALGDYSEEEVTEEVLENWIEKRAETLYHPTSTARMGLSPKDSVVDTEMRVHGISGLRVCDAAVFPAIVSGHTTAPVIAFAEKAADMIKETWKGT